MGPHGINGEFYQTLKEELTSIIPKIEYRTLSESFYEATITLIPKLDKDTRRKENHTPISLKIRDAKILNKILAN